MKKKLIILNLLLSFVLLATFNSGNSKVHATELEHADEFVGNNESISNHSIIVILNEEDTYSFKEYNENNFEEYNCISVEELTAYSSEIVKEQLISATDSVSNIDLNSFRRMLKLTVQATTKNNILNMIEKINEKFNFQYVGPEFIYAESSTYPFDSTLLNNTQWAHNSINLPKAWDYTTGSDEIYVGVIDTGIDGTHEYLKGNLDNGLHMDFSGNTPEPLNIPIDSSDHGTHVAGIIGAESNSSTGTVGVCWDVNIVSLRISINGYWYSSKAIQAVDYAILKGIDVLNYSGRVRDEETNEININDPAFSQIISNYPGLFVAAAGNYFSDNDEVDIFPANYSLTHSNVISVGSLDIDNRKSEFSDYGIHSVQIYAPGDKIYSTVPGNSYDDKTGTSMAAPYVTGVAALLLSINPNLTGAQLKNILINSSSIILIEVNDGTTHTARKLDAYNAVKYVLSNYGLSTTLNDSANSLSKSIDSASTFFNEKNYFLKLNVEDAYEYDFTISSFSSLEVTLYDSNFNKINVTQISTNGGLTKAFRYHLSVGTYYLQSNYVGSTANGTVNVSIEQHAHSYTMQYYNYKWHKLTCECGQTTGSTQVHTVLQSEIVNGRYAECLGCHHLLDLNSDMALIGGMNSASVKQVSIKGSYVLPSGIIVLVEEDLDSYLNGNLVFYDEDKVPVIQ